MGRFDLTHGALVAQKPGEFGIKEVWQVEGDELGTGLFWAANKPSKKPAEHDKLEGAIVELSSGWRLHRYPWAGALSTAHTMLYYAKSGKDVFRALGPAAEGHVPNARVRTAAARFDVSKAAARAAHNEAVVWNELVNVERRVTSKAYFEKTKSLPKLKPSAGTWSYETGHEPERVGDPHERTRRSNPGRRPSHSSNATKP